jgi:hypothetical protein
MVNLFTFERKQPMRFKTFNCWEALRHIYTSKLEKIQERALWFIYEDYESTYDELLEKAKVPSLKVRRMRTMAIECFKILNKLSPSCLHDLVVFKDCKYNFRIVNLFNFERKQPMRFKTFNCWEALRHIFLIW